MTYGTSIHALVDRGHIKEGDTLLVLGASGGVGIAAVELGKAFGARVVAGVSSEEKADIARAAGADEVVVYGRQPFDKDASKALARSEEHTSELQSLMRISYAVFCLKKKKQKTNKL